LQRALGYRTPEYAHLPLVVDKSGAKIGKRDGALPSRSSNDLQLALRVLGIEVAQQSPEQMLRDALDQFSATKIPAKSWTLA
jgi:glutamyl/glutaminyl-tRNA synthetase